MKLPIEFETAQFAKGLAVRREVLGNEYVDRSLENVSEFMIPLQKLITEYCWGEVWARPGLDRKQRSFINLAMIAALNRPNELRLHVLGALKNGVTISEIQEIMLQVTIYCGVPAGLDSTKLAKEVIDKYQSDKAGGQAS
ncbi:MAG: carboxymuconolactone decarboxylase family protein [Pseudomonadota bacterium]